MMLDRERYLRQISLEEIGEAGQMSLAAASVLIVGVGGLGSPIATLLASSGVGRLGLVDFDLVSRSNLPRQTLYAESNIGLSKVECAASRLRDMNSGVCVEVHNLRLDEASAEWIISQYDIVVDGTDNPASRYLIDEVCGRLNRPYVYGAIRAHQGQVSVFHHNGAGGYADLYPPESAPFTLAPPPVLSATPAVIGAIEANEVIKLIVGYGETLSGRLLNFDLRDYSLAIFEL
ncbi:MAG: HesA/MoeB/ThiF family protein [Rikenellaceae bacterium]